MSIKKCQLTMLCALYTRSESHINSIISTNPAPGQLRLLNHQLVTLVKIHKAATTLLKSIIDSNFEENL